MTAKPAYVRPRDRSGYVSMKLLNAAKQGFYQNDGRKGLNENDFMAAIGVSAAAYRWYSEGGTLIVSQKVLKKLRVLASPRAPHFRTLFAVIDARTGEDTDRFVLTTNLT